MFNEALRNMPLLFSQMTCVEEMGFNATYCAHQDTMAKADADRVQRRASTLTNDAVTGQACLQVIVMIFIARASDHYGRRIAMFFVVFGNALDCAAFALVRVSTAACRRRCSLGCVVTPLPLAPGAGRARGGPLRDRGLRRAV